jgi:hypothetical protein
MLTPLYTAAVDAVCAGPLHNAGTLPVDTYITASVRGRQSWPLVVSGRWGTQLGPETP